LIWNWFEQALALEELLQQNQRDTSSESESAVSSQSSIATDSESLIIPRDSQFEYNVCNRNFTFKDMSRLEQTGQAGWLYIN
jgi:hypothetical protein